MAGRTGFITHAEQVLLLQQQNDHRQRTDHQKFGDPFKQLNQSLKGEHPLNPLKGIEPTKLGCDRLDAEVPASQSDRANHRSDHQHHEQQTKGLQHGQRGITQMVKHQKRIKYLGTGELKIETHHPLEIGGDLGTEN